MVRTIPSFHAKGCWDSSPAWIEGSGFWIENNGCSIHSSCGTGSPNYLTGHEVRLGAYKMLHEASLSYYMQIICHISFACSSGQCMHASSSAVEAGDSHVIKLQGLPYETEKDDIIRWFDDSSMDLTMDRCESVAVNHQY
jgi:hypothetical protein